MSPKMRSDVPTSWAAGPEAWWAHVADCPYCSRFYAKPKPYCQWCEGTGWVTTDDTILGGLIDSRCPECSR